MSTKRRAEGLLNSSLSRQENIHTGKVLIFVLFTCLILTLGNDLETSCGDGPVGNAQNGIIKSPDYPNPYPIGLRCDWLISLNSSEAITFTIHEFDIDGGDSLTVYEQEPAEGVTPRWLFSGIVNNETEFVASNNKLWLKFTTQSIHSESLRRFYITYQSGVNFGLSQTCSDPGELQYGRVHGSQFTVDSELNFTCNTGYELRGDHTVICRVAANGTAYWSNDIPTCLVPCYWGEPSVNSHDGSYYRISDGVDTILSPEYPDNFDGVKICAWEIGAPDGFGINITSDTYIFSTRQFTIEIWGNSFKDLFDPEIQGTLFLNRINSLEPISASVPDKTVSLIFRSLDSSASGRFELKIARYALTSCVSPPVSNHLMYSPSKSRYSFDETVRYACKGTFVILREDSAPRENTCLQDGTWQIKTPRSLPVCSADCQKWHPLTQTYSSLVISSFPGELYSKGFPSKIPFGTCNYTFVGLPGYIFSLQFLSANVSSSLQLSYEEHHHESGMQITVLDSVMSDFEFRSKTNLLYFLVNETSDLLEDQFILRFDKVRTSGVECPDPGVPAYSSRTGQNFSIGSTVSFNCYPSFDTVGSSESTCFSINSTFATWLPPVPWCQGSCGGVFIVDNLTIVSPLFPASYDDEGSKLCSWNVTNTLDKPFEITLPELNIGHGDNLTITDRDGILLLNDLCTSNCSWFRRVTSSRSVTVQFNPVANSQALRASGDLLRFTLSLQSTVFTMCEMPNAPLHGRTIGNNYNIGSTVHYICVPPYDIEGPLASTCVQSPDGSSPAWDNPPPICHVEDCTPPSRPIVRAAGRGAIATPGYPGNMLKGDQECQWDILTSEDNSVIILHFRYLELPESSGGEEEQPFVLVFDTGEDKNTLLANFTSSLPVHNVTSVTNKVRVEYHGPEEDVAGHRGMYLEYDALPSRSTTVKTVKPLTTTTPFTPSRSSKATTKAVSTRTSIKASTSTTTTAMPSSSTTLSRPSTEGLERQGNDGGSSNTGGIVAGILVPLTILGIVSMAGYVWYRRKYPVRMVLGRDFAKFANPVYEKGASTLTLVKEDVPMPKPAQ